MHPLAPGFTAEDYKKRLDFELGVIAKMKFPGYFLIVADFIKWAKAHGIPVGPGRGSGAGSVVAWSLTITDLDPLRFGLLFERFLNPERISMPDFDIDFCQDRRDEVIRYVQQKYGADRVAQIITHGKLQARAVLRDVGRVLQMPYGQVDKLCKLVPNNPANPVTLAQAIEDEPKLQEARDSDPMVARLLEIAQKLEGLYRHASTHAAGMVIGDRPLDELVPLYRDPKSSFPITQFNWKLVEAAGLVKFDFLGLKTLTVLQKAVELIKRGRGVDIDLLKVPLDDRKTYELLARADTVGVFQLEGTGVRDCLKRLKPDRFEDIMAMTALYRPGPMDNIPTYINRKHGEEPVDCLHPMLEPILKETYGVIIYQEQVLQIAQVMAGYSLGQADILRKAMGKKDKAIMAKQQAEFVAGAVKKGVEARRGRLHLRAGRQVRGLRLQQGAHGGLRARGLLHGLPQGELPRGVPGRVDDARHGQHRQARHVHGRGQEVGHRHRAAVHQRLGGGFPARREAHPLLAGGAQEHRRAGGREPGGGAGGQGAVRGPRRLRRALRPQGAQQARAGDAGRRRRLRRVRPQPGAGAGQRRCHPGLRQPHRGERGAGHRRPVRRRGRRRPRTRWICAPVKTWTPMEKLQHEFDAVGFFLSGHPLDAYAGVLGKLGVVSFAELEARADRGATAGRLAGVVVNARERRSQKGNKFAFAMFSEPTGQFEAVIFSETLAQSRHLLEPGTAVLINVEGERDGEALKLRAQSIESLDKAAEGVQKGVKVVLDGRSLKGGGGGGANGGSGPLDELKALLKPNGKGTICLSIALEEKGREAEIALPGFFDISPGAEGRDLHGAGGAGGAGRVMRLRVDGDARTPRT